MYEGNIFCEAGLKCELFGRMYRRISAVATHRFFKGDISFIIFPPLRYFTLFGQENAQNMTSHCTVVFRISHCSPQKCSGIINPLFDGFTYNTCGQFCLLLVFFLAPKIQRNSQNICAYYMLNHRISCIYYMHEARRFVNYLNVTRSLNFKLPSNFFAGIPSSLQAFTIPMQVPHSQV